MIYCPVKCVHNVSISDDQADKSWDTALSYISCLYRFKASVLAVLVLDWINSKICVITKHYFLIGVQMESQTCSGLIELGSWKSYNKSPVYFLAAA